MVNRSLLTYLMPLAKNVRYSDSILAIGNYSTINVPWVKLLYDIVYVGKTVQLLGSSHCEQAVRVATQYAPPRPLYARCGPPPVHTLHALRLRRPACLAPWIFMIDRQRLALGGGVETDLVDTYMSDVRQTSDKSIA